MFPFAGAGRMVAAAAKPAASRRGVATYTDIVVSPPQVRLSLAEKVFHGVLITFGMLGYPLYASFKVAEIKQAEYDTLEIPEKWQQWEAQQKK